MKSNDGTMRFDVRAPKEKGELIKKNAEAAGMSDNQYIVEMASGNPSAASGWKGKVAGCMCKFWDQIDQKTGEDLRKSLIELRNEIWQHLK